MFEGRTVFAQLMDQMPRHTFRRLVQRYGGDERVRSFTCLDQFLCMAFAQLTYRESLRDIEACLGAMPEKLYHLGFRTRTVAKSTLADANETRPWRIYADFAQVLIGHARSLYASDSFGVELARTVYALDSTTIDLCLSLFPWAHFRLTKAAIKLHTVMDLRGSIPTFIRVTDRKVHDVNILDELIPEPGSIYVMDRGYIDFARLHALTRAKASFVTRAKKNFSCQRRYSASVDRSTVCDQTVVLSIPASLADYPDVLRRIRFRDPKTGKNLVFITNDFALPALTVTELYRSRWKIEIFFKWIKQHLRIKAFYGTSENAVKTQIWIAICVYVLVAILAKRLRLERDHYTILKIHIVTHFEKIDISQALTRSG
jgi:hypothetical protein